VGATLQSPASSEPERALGVRWAVAAKVAHAMISALEAPGYDCPLTRDGVEWRGVCLHLQLSSYVAAVALSPLRVRDTGRPMAEESMTSDLIELTRCLYEAGGRRDADAVLSYCARDAVLDAADAGLGIFEGTAAIRPFLEDWWGSYEEYKNATDEIRQVGSSVLAINTLFGRLPGMGEPVRLHNAFIFRFSDGLIVRWTAKDTDEARAGAQRLAESSG
jgi:ketosteroid isomerase-like protein